MTDDALSNALALQPLVDSTMSFVEFLKELKGNEDRVATAPAVVLRSIHELGMEDPREETNPERRRFLHVLKKVGIPSWKAFYHVCGSQLFAHRLMKRFLEPAAANGAQLKKMLIVRGGPGAGKDYFKDGIERALDQTAMVYAVHGCPDHENPINLLKLLPVEQLDQVAELAGLTREELDKLMLTAGTPCQVCYTSVMGTLENPKDTPSLADIKVVKINLSSRSTGVFEWKPGQDCSLVAALRRSNRGFISMPDAFLEREVKPGDTDERLILLDATQYRRLPGECAGSDKTVAASPLDVFMFATTNENSLEKFLDSLPDKDAFTGRADQLKLPYNLILVEEIRAYESEMRRYEEVAKFGPLALRMIATLAVLSRYAVPKDDEAFIHPIDRMRMLQGEDVKVKPMKSSDWDEIWAADPVDSGGPMSHESVGRTTLHSRRGGSGFETSAKSLPKDVRITPELMWSLIGPDEGLVGLDMRFMMSLLSRLNQYGLENAKKKRFKGDSSVTALEAIMLLRSTLYTALMDDNNLTEEQKKVLERCQKWLGGRPQVGTTWTAEAASKPGLIESEYRRLLKQQILRAFSPDYDARAQEMFEDYLLHNEAWTQGKSDVKHPKHKLIPVDEGMLDDLDQYRLGRRPDTRDDDDMRFRKGLTIKLRDAKDEYLNRACVEKELEPDCEEARKLRIKLASGYKADWQAVPELANAIRAKLDKEIGDLVRKLITTEVKSDLDKDERERLEVAQKALEDLGYSEKARETVLAYAKKVEVWKHQS